MAYRISERTMQNRMRKRRLALASQELDAVDVGDLATIFIFFGILGLITSWIYSGEKGKEIINTVHPARNITQQQAPPEFGPIQVANTYESYQIRISATGIPNQSWTFVQGSVLDAKKQYLFAFGEELWHESGYDEGPWEETHSQYEMDVSFPNPGTYYVQLAFESSRPQAIPGAVTVRIIRKRGSYVPHLWFGLFSLMIGIILNELKNRTVIRFIDRLE